MGHQVVLTGRNGKQNLVAADFSGGEPLAVDVSCIESGRDVFTEGASLTKFFSRLGDSESRA